MFCQGSPPDCEYTIFYMFSSNVGVLCGLPGDAARELGMLGGFYQKHKQPRLCPLLSIMSQNPLAGQS